MTSDQRTSGSGGGYIEQHHLLQEGIDYDPAVDGATPSWMVRGTYIRTSRGSGGDGGYSYQTTSGHGAQHAQLSITSTLLAPQRGLRTRRL